MDADLGTEHVGEQEREVVERCLGRRVRDRGADRAHAGERRDVEDHCVARRSEVRHGGTDDVPRPDHVDPEDLLPDLGGRCIEVVVGDDRGRAGVVDDDVEPSVVPDGGVDEVLGLRRVGDVCLHVDGVGELVGQLLARRDGRGGVDDDAGAEFGEPGGDGGPDSARRTRDERDESLHVVVVAHGAWRGDWSGW